MKKQQQRARRKVTPLVGSFWQCPLCGHLMTEEESKGYRQCPTGTHLVRHTRIGHGARVFYGNTAYAVADIKLFPHGYMVGIYDEPPSRHVDYLSPYSCRVTSNNRISS
jgi:hypothetical protein